MKPCLSLTNYPILYEKTKDLTIDGLKQFIKENNIP